jgi:hypothetical protein
VLAAAWAAACPAVSGLARFAPAASALVGLSLAWALTSPAQPTAAMRRHRTKQGSHGSGWPHRHWSILAMASTSPAEPTERSAGHLPGAERDRTVRVAAAPTGLGRAWASTRLAQPTERSARPPGPAMSGDHAGRAAASRCSVPAGPAPGRDASADRAIGPATWPRDERGPRGSGGRVGAVRSRPGLRLDETASADRAIGPAICPSDERDHAVRTGRFALFGPGRACASTRLPQPKERWPDHPAPRAERRPRGSGRPRRR